MIFYGDIAVSASGNITFNNFPSDFFQKKGFANLEGSISLDDSYVTKNVVYNSPKTLEMLNSFSIVGVSLANNHIFDLGPDVFLTKQCLTDNGIVFSGLGKKNEFSYSCFVENEIEIVVVPFGWDVIGCHYGKKNKEGVVPFEKKQVCFAVSKIRNTHPNAYIVLFPHWNFELYDYPVPIHRELARLAIDNGANAVIGCHPHCVGGGELYNGGIIAYSLGNFCFESSKFMSGRLRFPKKSEREIAIELTPERIIVHHILFNRNTNVLTYEKSESFENYIRKNNFNKCMKMDNIAYSNWYKKNNPKKPFLPSFYKLSSKYNGLKKIIIRFRQVFINILWATRIKRRRSNDE